MALRDFKKAISYVAKDSIQNAGKVKREILQKIETILKNPETCSLDKYKEKMTVLPIMFKKTKYEY